MKSQEAIGDNDLNTRTDTDVVDKKGPLEPCPSVESHEDRFLLISQPISQTGQPQLRHKRRFLAGWRTVAVFSLVGATLVCIFNLVVTIKIWKHPKNLTNGGGSIANLFTGSCAHVRSLNVWTHLVVNFVGSLLLAASNYCMQVLNAPSRDELVRAHSQRKSLDIGVQSLRNLVSIGWGRSTIWILLFLSSLPLHLLYNSVVFTNLQANEYVVIPTTEGWLQGGQYDTSRFMNINENQTRAILADFNNYKPNLADIATNAKYMNVSAAECFSMYESQYVSEVGNLYIVQENPTVWRNLTKWYPRMNSTTKTLTWIDTESKDEKLRYNEKSADTSYPFVEFPFRSFPNYYPSNGWRCPSHRFMKCDTDNELEVPRDRSKWEPYESPIKYCLIQRVEEHCKLLFSIPIAIAVVASNFVKALCIALILVVYRKHVALVTLGDAIAYFLDQPDPETRGRCLHGRRLIEAEWNWEKTHGAKKGGLGVEPERFHPERVRWARAPGNGRWIATYAL